MSKEKMSRGEKMAKMTNNWFFRRFGVDERQADFGNLAPIKVPTLKSTETVLFERSTQE